MSEVEKAYKELMEFVKKEWGNDVIFETSDSK